MSFDWRVEHAGAQRKIFETGKADGDVALAQHAGKEHLYALGPVAALDGEITIFDSEVYVSRVRGADGAFEVDRTLAHDAIFLAWTQVRTWLDVAIPQAVSSYAALEHFVAEAASANGIDTQQPFPFLMAGTPRELRWHINVDRTAGQPITRERFRASKQPYALHDENIDIFGVYSNRHGGIFMSEGLQIHVHFVSRETPATGHIDEIAPGGMTLRLPR